MLLMVIDECSEVGSTTDEDSYCPDIHPNHRTNQDGLFDDVIEGK
ncbi:hypothetical protein SAMN05421858_3363 [Haladaptatus litoreus]|uniref:Uncharacterized protein n=1 Tax=Haladaptatus litoreus TaxID=553468 RepID=A0A1N7CZP1_9EURY|nr:hypothetical protein SAMN05421858_3363 [Haladaptatus litoreus]